MESKIDSVTLSVLWKRLIAVSEEMGTTLRSTAYSVAVREGDDFSTGLFDARGRLVAQGNFNPGHTGAMPSVVSEIMRYHSRDDMQPGDILICNDSAIGSGHFPDIFMVSPVHLADKLIGFVVSIAHHVDVGGPSPGSQEVLKANSAVYEGLRILPVHFANAGKTNPDIVRMITANVRFPEQVKGDLEAQKSANEKGISRFVELVEVYGEMQLEAAFDEIINRSKAETQQQIRKVPNGTYSFSDRFDDFGPGTEPIEIAVSVIVEDESITVDFDGTSKQVPTALNCYYNFTAAYARFAIRVAIGALHPQNSGSIEPIRVRAEEGSFVNARYPAPSGGRAICQIRLFEVIHGALSEAVPGRTLAGFSHWSNPNISFYNQETGEQSICYDLIFGGFGATRSRDGTEGMSPVINCSNVPIEIQEAQSPLLYRYFGFMADTGGQGQYRGGLGVRKDVEFRGKTGIATLLGDRHLFRPFGIRGGDHGMPAKTTLHRGEDILNLNSKQTIDLEFGDVLSFQLSGGGGYGDPAERDARLRKRDIEEGYVTATSSVESESSRQTESA